MDEALKASYKEDNSTPVVGHDALSLSYPIQVTMLIAMTIHFLLSVGLNSFNILVLRRGDCGFEYRARQFGRALAVIDQLFALTSLCSNVMRFTSWQDTHSCVYVYLLQHTFGTLSHVYMSALSGDRFLRIWKPFLYERFITNTVATTLFTCLTILCLAGGTGQLVSWKHTPTVLNECFLREEGASREKLWMLLMFVLPVIAIATSTGTQIGTLVVTFQKIRAENRLQPRVSGNFLQDVGERGHFRLRYLKGIRTVLILILSSYIVALPAVTIRVVRDMSNRGNSLFMAFQFVTLTSFINTWWKPFIFLTTNKQYRSAAKQEYKRFRYLLGLEVNQN